MLAPWAGLTAFLASSVALGAESDGNGIEAAINNTIGPVTDAVSSFIFYSVNVAGEDLPLVVVWLMLASVIFTLYMGFINIRGFAQAIRVVRGDYQNPEHQGEVTHFQALSAALSGTVGVGNIAGVAVAIALGGPGAAFWIVIAGLFGMTTKMIECTLGVMYRKINPDGSVSGGPMYYLSRGFAELGWPRLGRALAVFAAVMCLGASINLFQVNQAYTQFSAVTGFDQAWVFGAVVAVLAGLVIIGGIKSIARVAARLVPVMCGIYLVASLGVIGANIDQVGHAISLIFWGAFSPEGVAGGFIGVLIVGMRRATFSNEAGVGSAAIVHSAVRTNEPVTEGFVALLEPFIDTVVVCSISALVIVISGAYQIDGLSGIELTSTAFATVFGWFPVVLMVVIMLFAYSTIVTWAYYGMKAWTYLVGESQLAEYTYKVAYCLILVVGAVLPMEKVVDFVDSMFFAMALPNVIGLYFLAPKVRREVRSYLARVKSGEIKSNRQAQNQE